MLTITDEGRQLFRTLHPRSIAALDRVLAAPSERERETLRFLLARVIQANEAADAPVEIRHARAQDSCSDRS